MDDLFALGTEFAFVGEDYWLPADFAHIAGDLDLAFSVRFHSLKYCFVHAPYFTGPQPNVVIENIAVRIGILDADSMRRSNRSLTASS